MFRNQKTLVLILFFVPFLLMSFLAILTPYKYWDETIYANLGKNLAIYKEYSFSHGFSDFYPNLPRAGARPLFCHFLQQQSFFSLKIFSGLIF